MRVPALLVIALWLCCSGWATAQTYTQLGMGSTTDTINPCSKIYYELPVDATVTDFLQIEISSNETLLVTLANVPLDEFLTAEALVTEDVGVSFLYTISCALSTFDNLYLFVENIGDEISEYDIDVTQSEATVTSVPVNGAPVVVDDELFDNDEFSSEYAYFSLDFSGASVTDYTELKIIITSDDDFEANIYLNAGALPNPSDSLSGSCVATASSSPNNDNQLTVSSCSFYSLYSTNGGDTWYFALSSDLNGSYDFNITATLADTTVVSLTENAEPGFYNLTNAVPSRYFQFTSSLTEDDNQEIVFYVDNVEGGSVSFGYSSQSLPDLCQAPENNCDTNNDCRLTIYYCNTQAVVYYITVTVDSFTTQNSQAEVIYFEIGVNVTDVSDPLSLSNSEYTYGMAYQNNIDTFKIDNNGFDDSDDTYLNVHLYIDQYSDTNLAVTLYVNPDAPAGGPASCYDAISSCTISNSGACTVQIDPCVYNEHDDWYVSVSAGNTTTYYGSPVRYTVLAELANPTSLSQVDLVNTGLVYDNTYSQYRIDSSLVSEGSIVYAYISNIDGGSVDAYVNYNELAGDASSCCYDNEAIYTDITTSRNITLSNCDGDDSDFYLAVFGDGDDDSSDPVTFSITLQSSDLPNKPSSSIGDGDIIVDSLNPGDEEFYSVNGDDDDNSIYVFELFSVSSSVEFSMTVYNTSFINCRDVGDGACSTDSNGYCTIVLQGCIQSSGNNWIVSVENDDNTYSQFNLKFSIQSPNQHYLDNGQTVASVLPQYQYAQYQYNAAGQDTILLEVYFDVCLDSNGNQASGQLYVSQEGPYVGASSCYGGLTPVCTSTTKCVYVLSACDVPGGTYYISLLTTNNLKAQNPLGFTLTLTEKSMVESLETINVPQQFLMYPGQTIYNSFVISTNYAQGTVVQISISNTDLNGAVVSGFLSQSFPPSEIADSCPCYDYDNTLTTTSNPVVIDYCNSIPGTWTMKTTVSSATSLNHLVGYTLLVNQWNQVPSTLTVGAPAVQSSASPNYYKFYKLSESNSAANSLVLGIYNVQRGTVNVFYSFDYPATASCNVGTLCSGVTSCFGQLSCAADGVAYVSVQGITSNTTQTASVDFTIEVNNTAIVTLQERDAHAVSLESGYQQSFNISVATDLEAPLLQVSLTDITPATNNPLTVQIYDEDLCGTPIWATTCSGSDTCVLKMPYCVYPFSTTSTLYVTVLSNAAQDLTFDITYDQFDTASGLMMLEDPDYTETLNLSAGDYQMIGLTVTEDMIATPTSLTLSVTSNPIGSATTFYMFNEYPSYFPCNTPLGAQGSIEIPSCCVETGTYYLLIACENDATVTVSGDLDAIENGEGLTDLGNVPFNVTLSDYPLDDLLGEMVFYVNKTEAYLGFTFQVSSSDGDISLSFERVSAAGDVENDARCYTDNYIPFCFDNVLIGTSTNTYCSMLQCDTANLDVGTYYIGIEGDMGDTDLLVTSSFYDNITLTLDNTAINNQILDVLGFAYFQFEVDESLLYQFNQLNIAITYQATNATVVPVQGYITVGSPLLCSFSIATCTDTYDIGNCDIALDLCGAVAGKYYLTLLNMNIVPITYSVSGTVTITETPTVLDENDVVDGTDAYYSFSINSTDSSQYATLQVLTDTVTTTTIQWWYYEVGGYCSSPRSLTCSNSDECNLILYDCDLADTTYIVSVTTGSTYTIEYQGVTTETPTAITMNTITEAEITSGTTQYYVLDFDRSQVQPGQNLQIALNNECGTATMYIGQGYIPGPNCNDGTGTLYSIGSCEFLNPPDTAYDNMNWYIAVVGQVDYYYQEFGLKTRYQLTVTVGGTAYNFAPLGVNQQVNYKDLYDVYMFYIPGLGDISGDLMIDSTGVSYSFDDPILTGCTTASQCTGECFISQCDLQEHRTIYFQFNVGSTESSYLFLAFTRPWTRDLNTYGSPQDGAVVPSTSGLQDEEYYQLDINFVTDVDDADDNDFYIYSFRLNATIVSGGDVSLLYALNEVPSSCGGAQNTITTDPPNSPARSMFVDWCQITQENNETKAFFTVDATQGTSTVAVPYTLYWDADVDVINVDMDYVSCYTVEANSWVWFEFTSEYTAGSYLLFNLYAVQSGSLSVYVEDSGLATNNCYTVSATCSVGLPCALPWYCEHEDTIVVGVQNSQSTEVSFYAYMETVEYNDIVTVTSGTEYGPSTLGRYQYTFPSLSSTDVVVMKIIATGSSSNSVNIYLSDSTVPSTAGACSQFPGDSCDNGEICYILMSRCEFSGMVYATIVAETNMEYIMEILVIDTAGPAISLNSVVEGSLFLNITGVDTPIVSFPLTITSADLQDYAETAINFSVFGVNQGEISVWVSQNSADCQVAGTVPVTIDNEQGLVTLESCDVVASTYYLVLKLEQQDSCVPVTYGVYTSPLYSGMSSSGGAIDVTSTSYTGTVTDGTNYFYSSGGGSDASTYIEIGVFSYSTGATFTTEIYEYTSQNGGVCSVSSTMNGYTYLWGCKYQSSLLMSVDVASNPASEIPDEEYYVSVSYKSIQTLEDSTAISNSFTAYQQQIQMYSFDYDDDDSFVLSVDVTSGPAVTVTLYDGDCMPDDSQAGSCACLGSYNPPLNMGSFSCYSGECQLPISWKSGYISSGTIYATVEGYAPTSYSIMISQGEEANCEEPDLDDDAFCNVDWPVWNYNSGTNGTEGQNQFAIDTYNYLLEAFSMGNCFELSDACNQSLINYACETAYPACDSNGYLTSICVLTCDNVETNCGMSFASVGLGFWSCNHNFYLGEDDEICTDIYDVTDGNGLSAGGIAGIVIAALVAFIALVILVAVAGFVGYKYYQHRKRGQQYDVLKDEDGGESVPAAESQSAGYGTIDEA